VIGIAQEQRRFLWLSAAIVLLSWLLREQFILFTDVVEPIRGDVRQYVSYAWNLIHHRTFSMAEPGSTVIAPDAFRGPGYPLFLAFNLLIGGDGSSGWYRMTLQLQALLGAATVGFTIVLGRHWLARGQALAAGLLMALWPHHIAATGAVLSEVLFGFLLVLSMWLMTMAIARKSQRMAIAAGAGFAFAYLVNPIVLLFPPLAALALLRVGQARQAAWLVLLPLLIACGWGLRSASLPDTPGQPGRSVLNFVEGSWPQYHSAHNYMDIDPIALQISKQITAEELLFGRSARKGLAAMSDRMAQDPAYYVRWYLFRKPWLLWDWGIRIGWGDVYYQQILHSPLDVNPPLRAIKTVLRLLNPLIFLLALVSAIALIGQLLRRTRTSDEAKLPAALVALFCVYVTVLHTVFQAEPRYSIPYRPMELLLAVTALAGIAARMKTGRGIDESSVARGSP
jgi:4-amino-4-deoxy-L-arabinose transferase-like glycosyltransferase